MRISVWSSDCCSSDVGRAAPAQGGGRCDRHPPRLRLLHRRRGMNLKSLRFRLLAGGAVAVAVALVAAWFFLPLLFEHHLERRLAAELQPAGVRLVSGLTVGPGDSLSVDRKSVV